MVSQLEKHATSLNSNVARSSPVVVSEEAEALSHSETTMKLTPSFELFQLLEEFEGGKAPPSMSGNALRTSIQNGKDTLAGFDLSEYLQNLKLIEALPDPFKMVENRSTHT